MKKMTNDKMQDEFDQNFKGGDASLRTINNELDFTCNMELFNKAISHNWESLIFESGVEIAKLKIGNFMIALGVSGETKIFDNDKEQSYKGTEIVKNKDLMKVIENGNIYDDERYEVIDNNWYCLTLYELGGIDFFAPFNATEEEIEGIEKRRISSKETYYGMDDVVFDGVDNVSDLLKHMIATLEFFLY